MTHITNSKKEQKTVPNSFTSDNLGARAALNAFGFDNDKIGFDGNAVTYDGNYVLTPAQNNDGITKTTTDAIIKGANNIYKNSGKDDYIADVTAYAASKTHLPDTVKYHSNGAVTVGGVPIENVVIIDGNSYAPKSSIEAAVNSYLQNSGHSTYSDLANEYLSRTKSEADSYADRINNYEDFSYNPETDPAYQAYKEAYLRNAQAAYDDTYALGASRTGGYANTAAYSAAANAYYNHMNALADRIPELMDDAYDRYADKYDMLIQGMEMYGSPTQRQKLLTDARSLDYDALVKALEADYERDKDNREFSYKQAVDQRDFDYDSYVDSRDFDYKKFIDNQNFEYKKYADSLADSYDRWELENILQPKADAAKTELETQRLAQQQQQEYHQALMDSLKPTEPINEPLQDDSVTGGFFDNLTTEELLNYINSFH